MSEAEWTEITLPLSSTFILNRFKDFAYIIMLIKHTHTHTFKSMEYGGHIYKLFRFFIFFLFGHVSCKELKLWPLQWKLKS